MGKIRKQYEKVDKHANSGINGPWFGALHELLEMIVDELDPKHPPKGAAPQGINPIRPTRDDQRD